jgi:hypothetical protein
MAKVVTERPRRGHGNPSQKTGRTLQRNEFDLDDVGPTRFPISRHHQQAFSKKFDAKGFSDLLNPLERFLRSKVGRPWDKVYSELSQTLDRRSMAGLHIWSHVKDYVKINCFMYAGRVWQEQRFGGDPHLVEGFYVHPRTGLLLWSDYKRWGTKRQQALRHKQTDEEKGLIKVDAKNNIERVEGIWYLVTLVKVVKDIFGRDNFVYRKKQLNTRELREAGLKNSIKEAADA